jgi:acetyl-CoA acetyltransferase
MTHAFICDAIRTPIGRYGGSLSSVRTDDLGAVPIRALMAPHPTVDWAAVDDPLGMSGARLITTAINQLHRTAGRYALCTMCIGVGQGIAVVVERS